MTTPYGAWASPITADVLTTANVGLGSSMLDGADTYWLESRPDQGGRSSIWRLSADGARTEVTPEHYVRTMVHEYGGGAYDVNDGVVVYSNVLDGRLYRASGGSCAALTAADDRYRFADVRVHAAANLVLAVREDHTGEGEAVNTIVALALDGADQLGEIVCSGADFYATPELSGDGRLAWTEWDHPNMPWDSTRVQVGRFGGTTVSEVECVAGAAGDESVVHPRWTPNGTLIVVSDRSGWWNLYQHSESGLVELCPLDAEFTGPQWVHGMNPYAVIDDDRLLCSYIEGGADKLGVVTISTGSLEQVATDATAIDSVRVLGDRAVFSLAFPDRSSGIGALDLKTLEWTQIRSSNDTVWDSGLISVAESVSWEGDQGTVHGWFYPPTNHNFVAPEGTLPPLITMSHGGPTSMAKAALLMKNQYWTSRGFAILDVNYGGSTGYGREYRQRLNGNWGIVDTADCVQGALAMAAQGRVDPARLAISGGSAGGYTTLNALTTTDVFAVGVSLFGVGDLEALARDTHKFESRYLDGLVGPYPEAAELYRDRSPIHRVDGLNCPVLLLQGLDDKVVPPAQAQAMADAARAKGLPVALIMFEGEGHGFRRAENVKASYEAQLSFFGQTFGFEPADNVTPIEIENL